MVYLWRTKDQCWRQIVLWLHLMTLLINKPPITLLQNLIINMLVLPHDVNDPPAMYQQHISRPYHNC